MLDPKAIAAILGALAIGAGAATGLLKITTPEAAECSISLADKSARLELTTKAMESCSAALTLCSGAP